MRSFLTQDFFTIWKLHLNRGFESSRDKKSLECQIMVPVLLHERDGAAQMIYIICIYLGDNFSKFLHKKLC